MDHISNWVFLNVSFQILENISSPTTSVRLKVRRPLDLWLSHVSLDKRILFYLAINPQHNILIRATSYVAYRGSSVIEKEKRELSLSDGDYAA